MDFGVQRYCRRKVHVGKTSIKSKNPEAQEKRSGRQELGWKGGCRGWQKYSSTVAGKVFRRVDHAIKPRSISRESGPRRYFFWKLRPLNERLCTPSTAKGRDLRGGWQISETFLGGDQDFFQKRAVAKKRGSSKKGFGEKAQVRAKMCKKLQPKNKGGLEGDSWAD